MMRSTDDLDIDVAALQQKIRSKEADLRELKLRLQQAEQKALAARQLDQACSDDFTAEWMAETLAAISQGCVQEIREIEPAQSCNDYSETQRWPLKGEEYKRYGRQLIMPEVGIQGQLRLKNAKVLIVGIGGLGCPAAMYLAGAGVGTIGLVDGDTVEASNLHRQIAHSTARVGMTKVDSAIECLSALNPIPKYIPHRAHLSPETAIAIISQYDIVLDCTDHPTSRYLISDACVLCCKPIVSASALRTEGQLMVLNNPSSPGESEGGGPCYRCVFPRPPPVSSVLSCGEAGILGPVVGVMGVLQAVEGVKLLLADKNHKSAVNGDDKIKEGLAVDSTPPTMLIFSAFNNPPFRTVRLRSRRKNCAVCSESATISKRSLTSGSIDYVAFCNATSAIEVLTSADHIEAAAFAALPEGCSRTLVDVRDEIQFDLCNIPGSVNVPWTGNAGSWLQAYKERTLPHQAQKLFTICRLGNDSQLAAKVLLDSGEASNVKNVKGGFRSWRDDVDRDWPDY